MKKRHGKRHTPEQIIKKLREADTMLSVGKTIGQVVQVLEISEQTFHRWRHQYGGMKAEEAKRLKELQSFDRNVAAYVCQKIAKLADDTPVGVDIAERVGVASKREELNVHRVFFRR